MWKVLSFWVWRTTRDFSRRSEGGGGEDVKKSGKGKERRKERKERKERRRKKRRRRRREELTVVDVATDDLAITAELDLDELSEAGGVVVPDGLGVTEGLEEGVGLDDLLLEDTSAGLVRGTEGSGGTGDGGEVLDDLLGVLGLSGTRLSGDEEGLVLLV